MITKLLVSGFKSLNDFRLEVRPGLNVLAGPNGSGKSNILSLFEFLSYISRYSLAEAVSRAGGAGALFTRESAAGARNPISIGVIGRGKSTPPNMRRYYVRHPREFFIEYAYEFTILLSEKGTSLRYGEQRLSFSVFDDESGTSRIDANTGEKRWHVDLVVHAGSEQPNVLRNKVNRQALKRVLGASFQKPDTFNLTYMVDPFNHPLFHRLGGFYPPVQKIINDISSGYVYNLDPNAIKQPEDIAHPPEISADGSGLAATLYSIEESERQGPYSRFLFVSMDDEQSLSGVTLQQLREMFCLINDNIQDVRVENDALENKLIVVAKIISGGGTVEIPLAMLSDGTVKWFSLVTAVLRQRAIFSLEEPENFLHPYMQKEIVDMLRSSNSDNPENFSLMTTHSESLLNALRPEEVVVVRMVMGSTTVFRSEHTAEISSEINESGFGLGRFYVAGALDP